VSEALAPEHDPAKPSQSKRRARRVKEVDFSRPTKFTQDQQRRIERAHESFCRSVSIRLSAELRAPIELEVINISQLTWSAAMADIPSPSIFGIVEVAPLGTRIVVSAELGAVVRTVERLLGGTGSTKIPQRELTDIELALTRRIFTMMLDQLTITWDELMGLQLTLVEFESQNSNVQVARTSEPTLTLTMELRLDQTSSTLSILVPWSSIEAAASKIPSGQYREAGHDGAVDSAAAEAVQASLAGVEVELRAEVASVEMTIADLLTLEVGDVVRFGVPTTDGVTICAHEVPIHRAKPGRRGNRRALEVLERLEGME
jgi:flagellar motor switch protein FliM